MDLWVEPTAGNLTRANAAFGSPFLLAFEDPGEIVQIGIAPNRIDLLQRLGDLPFEEAWAKGQDLTLGEAMDLALR